MAYQNLSIFNFPLEAVSASSIHVLSHQVTGQRVLADSSNPESNPSGPTTHVSQEEELTAIIRPGKSTCTICQVTFNDAEEQRTHYKLEWHRYNVKRVSQLGLQSLTEEEFEKAIEEDLSSISGSDSAESLDSNDELKDIEEDANNQAFRKADKMFSKLKLKHQETQNESDGLEEPYPVQSTNAPHISFTIDSSDEIASNSQNLDNTPPVHHFSLYKALFSPPSSPQTADSIHSLLRSFKQTTIFTLLLLSGGHFAGAVFSSNPKLSVLAHKTIHRYTTRRKQGGSQAANDASKNKNAKSAGANLRRYNEAALTKEVRDVLKEWNDKNWFRDSRYIFIFAPSRNKKVLYGYEDAVLESDDLRIRSFPFTIRRPTFNELKRSYKQLICVRVTSLPRALPRSSEYLTSGNGGTGEAEHSIQTEGVTTPSESGDSEGEPIITLEQPESFDNLSSTPDTGNVRRFPSNRKHKRKSRLKRRQQNVLPSSSSDLDSDSSPSPATNSTPSESAPKKQSSILKSLTSSSTLRASTGMTPELRMALEREKRARAAERRLGVSSPSLNSLLPSTSFDNNRGKNGSNSELKEKEPFDGDYQETTAAVMDPNGCVVCGIVPKTPLMRNSKRYCGIKCVRKDK
ncbi:hypothetical protein BKA69DRAFT_1128410 [Paraphysoderma sedebokerense]|nr:hypothetical protein BKA69DRAFT_1128410 [Paraphysoderma sedebokerense]